MVDRSLRAQEIDVEAVIADFGDLPTLAPVAFEVLRLADDDRAGLDDIAAAISHDPGLASQILRVANSSLYGMGGEVTSLSRATTILGLRTVKLLSLSFSVVTRAEGDKDDALIWRRTLAASALSRTIASECEPRLADEAFIAALLANVGRVAMLGDAGYSTANSEAGGWLTAGEEQDLFGVTTDEVSAQILTGWGLPAMLTDALRQRQDPGAADGVVARIAAILAVSEAAAIFVTADVEAAEDPLEACRSLAGTLLSMNSEDTDQLLADSQPALEEISAMFQSETPSDVPISELLAKTKESLARLSLDAAAALSQEHIRAEGLAEENQRLATEAATDGLTLLPNRRSFDEKLEGCIAARMRHDQDGQLGLLILDLDRFKLVNDTWGHPVGDDVLRGIAARMSLHCRADEFVARVGGEEFAVILPNADRVSLELAAERFRHTIGGEPLETGAGPLDVTVSIGGALVAEMGVDTAARIYESADKSLYAAKAAGRDCVRITAP